MSSLILRYEDMLSQKDAVSRRIETKTSRTAELTCIARAVSYFETREQYKSNDWVAPHLVPPYLQVPMRIGFLRRTVWGRLAPKGMYEYVIARTKYIDDVFQQALKDEFAQILILGAGFDSRGIRFAKAASKTTVFELDAPITQRAKIALYRRRGIGIPPALIFIPIDFENQTLSQRLTESGFHKGSKSLFLLEGLTMYLEPESLERTFAVISEYAGRASRVLFDYVLASVIRGESLPPEESEIRQSVIQVGEQWRFGIEKGQVEAFLTRFGFRLIEHQNAVELENRYFRTAEGTTAGHINRTHCIVIGEKS